MAVSHREGIGPIVGTIRDSDGLPVAAALVRAFAVRLRDEQPLGREVSTDAHGHYSISTGAEDRGDEAVPRNVRVAVIDKAGHELASSSVRFGVDGTSIDLTLPDGSSGDSEFERHVAALAPVLDSVSLAEANATDSAFLVGATGIPAPDLAGLIDAALRAGEEESATFPPEVFYGWYRQGLPLEPAALWERPTDELLTALRSAVETGVIPARVGDDLESIGARIEQLRPARLPEAPAAGTGDAPEEIRELPDVTIRVRETRPGFFEAWFTPTDPHHIARNGYTLDTSRGLRGRTLAEVLTRAEANWRQNYPSG